jgi:catechol 2,3-dioxygenase-like lactoylglutathione lyase family enzyme
MKVVGIDHFVLTVRDVGVTCDFYARVLGVEVEEFEGGRRALKFGWQKINLHQAGREFEPKAERPTPGSGDFCLITDVPVERVVEHLGACGVEIVEGPVPRTGATGRLESVYFRDPDGNLVELSNRAGSAGE